MTDSADYEEPDPVQIQLVAGAPGTGKSVLAAQLATQLALADSSCSLNEECSTTLLEVTEQGAPGAMTLPEFESFAAVTRSGLVWKVRQVLARFGSDLAEDVVQATLIILWQRWSQNAPDHPFAYAEKVAVRLAWRYVQAEESLRTVDAPEDSPAPRSADEVGAVPLRVDLDRAFSQLSDRQREILQLHLAGKTRREIARLLKISTGAVGAHLCAARKRLRAQLNDGTE